MQVPEGMAVAGEDALLERGFVREEGGAVVPVDGEGGGDGGEGGETGEEGPGGEEAGAVWGYLEAGLEGGGLAGGRREGEGGGGVVYADFLELFDGFEDGDAVGGVGEFGGEGGGEAGEAGADDDDVEGGGGCHFGWLLVKG